MKFKYKLLCLIVFLLSGPLIFAQQSIIKRKDPGPGGIVLADVNVFVDGTATGTLTDFDGNNFFDRREQTRCKFSLIQKYNLI